MIIEWAKKEVELACKRENPDRKEGEWDYSCACYESALKAYKSLVKDGHSGMSFSFTKNILIRLMECKPLTPIEDTEDIWMIVGLTNEAETTYQCKRMGSLFKTIKRDGSVSYTDNERYFCYDPSNPRWTYTGGGASQILDEMFPITMPYYPPTGKYKIEVREYLTDKKNGDFDTKEYIAVLDTNGRRHEINRYFGDVDGQWKELSFEEFQKRVEMHNKREASL